MREGGTEGGNGEGGTQLKADMVRRKFLIMSPFHTDLILLRSLPPSLPPFLPQISFLTLNFRACSGPPPSQKPKPEKHEQRQQQGRVGGRKAWCDGLSGWSSVAP